MIKPSKFASLVSIAALSLVCARADAQIRIGQTSGFTGPVATSVAEINVGAKLYIDHVNAEGGIGGQSIELVSLDDKNQPALTVENANKLVADPKVVALFLNRGTPHTTAMMPVLAQAKIVLLAPSTGAMSLHNPVNPWIFNVRATYQAETERLTRHLGMTKLDTVALCYVDDSFGTDALQGALKVFKEGNTKPVVQEAIDKAKPDYSACVQKIIANKQLGAVFIGTPVSVATGVKALRAAGSTITVATLSNNAASGFIKELGLQATGVVVSQVFPSERSLATPMIAEASKLAAAKDVKQLTPAMIEGFAAAKVLVVALKKAAADTKGGPITRASIKKALESFHDVDIGGGRGGVGLSYSPTDHSGLEYVDLSYIGPDGTFRR
jgi:ABC-type branched-subunit amino acid transport system substrate-binding protein